MNNLAIDINNIRDIVTVLVDKEPIGSFLLSRIILKTNEILFVSFIDTASSNVISCYQDELCLSHQEMILQSN